MNELTEKDILNGFTNIYYTRRFEKPWITFTEDKVVSTNGISAISIPLSLVKDCYSKWGNIFYSEPFSQATFPEIDNGRFLKINSEFSTEVLNTKPNKTKEGAPIVTPIELEIRANKFINIDWWGLVPIHNAMEYYGDDWFLCYQGKKSPLRFKNKDDIEMAVMPLS